MINITNQLISKSFSQRVLWIRRIFFIIVGIIVLRSVYLQIVVRPKLENLSERQRRQRKTIQLQRGPILDADENLLAVSLPLRSFFIIPSEVTEPNKTARKLAKTLNMNREKVQKKLTSKSTFVWLNRNTKPEVTAAINEMKLPGIHSLKEYQRYYPLRDHASQLLGFSGLDSKGLEGVEYYFNQHLLPKGRQHWNDDENKLNFNRYSGGSLKLTIRGKLQYHTEKELQKAVDTMEAKSGVAIIMESQTGKVLAMANIPDFDPNRFNNYNSSNFFNRAIAATYEPGSTFKVITLASALDTKSIKKDNIFNCENGSYQIHDRVIHDTKKHGWLTLEKILQKSSNICAAKIGQLITKPVFYKKIREFGFGSKTGISLPGETTGKVHPYQRWTDIDVATLSYGHSISVTPLQILTAVNSMATGGIIVPPTIVEEAKTAAGKTVEMPPRSPHRIVSDEVAKLLKRYMIAVTQKGGTAYSARIPGITIAGKTGTSRKFDAKKGRYSSRNHISSFVGFFPAEAPKLSIMVVLDDPAKPYLRVKSAVPVFREIAKQAIRFYPINENPQDNNDSEEVRPNSKQTNFKSIFQMSKVDPNKKIQGKNYFMKINKLLKKKTLREVYAIAKRENIIVKTKGSGIVKRVVKDPKRIDHYVVELE